MKEFFKFTLATILGLLVTGFIFMIIGIASVAGLLASSETETTLHNNSVFVLDLQGSIAERYQPTPIDQLLDEEQSVYGLNDISASIAKAKENDQIKGIYLNVGNFSCGSASLQEIRQALADFKESGKFIIAYGGGYSQSGYYLASIADKIILNPSGSISWHGLSAQTLFVKDLLKKVGINVQIFRVGTYKSAVEPLIGTEMSPANKEQTQAFVQSIWNQMADDIAQSRQLTQEQLNILADQYMDFQPADSCIANGLADTLMYKDEVLAYLKSQIGLKEKDKLHTLTLSDMINVKRNTPRDKSGNIIAVYYAYGEIDNSSSYNYNEEGINSEKVITDLRKLREDKNIKAVVLRVNSPGGSAYGSEQIWREVKLLKEEKPVIVSMGDYAASGGYYISCAADWIVAEPTTLTGSIGIFGMVPDFSELVTQKLDLHIDGVKTNKLADLGNIARPLNAEEKALIQQSVNNGYELFTRRCAEGRNMSIEDLKKIAEGRVWTGAMAKELKLVDELGNLQTALKAASQHAKIENYNVVAYPKPEDFLTTLMKTRKDSYIQSQVEATFGDFSKGFTLLKNLNKADRLQTRIPFELSIQ